MNRIIIAVMMLLAGFSAALADADIEYKSLVVSTKNGDKVEFRFTTDPVITFSGTDLVLTDINDDSVQFPMENVASLSFEADKSGVSSPAAADVRFSLLPGTLLCEGLEEGTAVNLYDLAGALVVSAVADGDGRATVALDALVKGVYAVSAAGHSFKFIK